MSLVDTVKGTWNDLVGLNPRQLLLQGVNLGKYTFSQHLDLRQAAKDPKILRYHTSFLVSPIQYRSILMQD